MEQYQDLVRDVLEEGTYKPNRTGVDTISAFNHNYSVDLQEGFPLLTTKKMDGYRWNSLMHELIWYFSGDEHIQDLQEETSIWDAWADDDGRLDTAYGRFWRRYPVPGDDARLDGEAWPDESNQWTTKEDDGRLTFDQLQYVVDTLNGDNPDKGPYSRRMVVNAWHPANAATSTLPPCHYTYAFNVQDGYAEDDPSNGSDTDTGQGTLNVHLTQRSGDVALGIPFNIACYSLITHMIAQQTGYEPGEFAHSIVDGHIYCGTGERGDWYADNLDELSDRVAAVEDRDEFLDVKDWIEEHAPEGDTDQRGKPYDHVPGLLEQLSREPLDKPGIEIADKPVDDLTFDDIQLTDYESYDGLDFGVAE